MAHKNPYAGVRCPARRRTDLVTVPGNPQVEAGL